MFGRTLLDVTPMDPPFRGRGAQIDDICDREQVCIKRRRDTAPIGSNSKQVVVTFPTEQQFQHLPSPVLHDSRPHLPSNFDLGANHRKQGIAEGLGETPLPEAGRQSVRNCYDIFCGSRTPSHQGDTVAPRMATDSAAQPA